MKIYIDSDYKCHISPAEGLREIEAPEFDGFCAEYIEGYRYIPAGETWERNDGVKCSGISPWKNYTELEKAQLEYELTQLKAELDDADAALAILGVNVDA